MKNIRNQLSLTIICLLLAAVCLLIGEHIRRSNMPAIEVAAGTNGDYIKWVDFNVSYEALCTAYNLDVESYDSPIHLNWIELLAYTGAKCGGSFGKDSTTIIRKLAKELSSGETTITKLTKNMDYYD